MVYVICRDKHIYKNIIRQMNQKLWRRSNYCIVTSITLYHRLYLFLTNQQVSTVFLLYFGNNYVFFIFITHFSFISPLCFVFFFNFNALYVLQNIKNIICIFNWVTLLRFLVIFLYFLCCLISFSLNFLLHFFLDAGEFALRKHIKKNYALFNVK